MGVYDERAKEVPICLKHPPQKVNTFDAGLMYLYLSMKLASNIFDAVLGT